MGSTYRELKERAWAANMEIPRRGLAIYTFGNVSALDPGAGVFAIKPSGVAYEKLELDDMVVIDLEGKIVEGKLRPSSDTKTHVVLYRNLRGIGASSTPTRPTPRAGLRPTCLSPSTGRHMPTTWPKTSPVRR